MGNQVNDQTSPPEDRGHIEIIELGSLDEVVAEFPTEASLLVDRPNASGPRDSVRPEDEFPCELSAAVMSDAELLDFLLVGEVKSQEPVQKLQSDVASLPEPVRVGWAHRPGPALAILAAVAVVALTGALGLGVFHTWRPQNDGPPPARASDVSISEAPTHRTPAPVESLAPVPDTQTSSIVGSTETEEERIPPPPRPEIVEQRSSSPATTVTAVPRPAMTAAVTSTAMAPPVVAPPVVTPPVVTPPVATPPRLAADVPAASPVGTASAPTTAGERSAVERPVDVNVAAAGRAPAAPVVTPNSAIERTLAQYQSAFSRLDVGAVRQVWPTVDSKALTRAFDQLRQENLTFDACDVRVFGSTAVASCVGTTQYVPKVGNKTPRVERQQWSISLRQTTDAWVIDTVDVARN